MSNLAKALATLFNIRSGEGVAVALLFGHAFFIGVVNVFFQTPASALFLSRAGVETLPYVYVCTAVVAVLLGMAYQRMETRFPPPRLFVGALVFLFVTILGLYFALRLYPTRWLAIALMIWQEVVWIVEELEFWALAGFLFNVRQGKRLFALAWSGEIVASILGGFLVPGLVGIVGTENLFLFATGGVVGSLFFLVLILKRFRDCFYEPKDGEQADEGEHEPFFHLFKNPYLALFFAVSVLSMLVFQFVDYIFYDQVEQNILNEAQLASFFGVFFAVLGIVNLVMNAFVSGPVLTRFGLPVGLLALPVVVAFGMGAAVLLQLLLGAAVLFFWLLVGTKLLDEVLRVAIEGPVNRILYQPLPPRRRLRVQTVRESMVETTTIGVAGLFLLILVNYFSFSTLTLCYLVLAIVAAWIVGAVFLRRKYTEVLTAALGRRRIGEIDFTLSDASSMDVLMQGLQSYVPAQVIYCLSVLQEHEHPLLPDFLGLLLDYPSADVREHVLTLIEKTNCVEVMDGVDWRINTEPESHVKGVAIRTLCALGESEVLERVAPFLKDPDDSVREGCIVGLLRSGGIEGVLLAGEDLNRAIDSSDPAQRRFAARVLGEVGITSFYRPLFRLLRDEDFGVRTEALKAAGKLKNSKLAPAIVENLTVAEVSRFAVGALIAIGDPVLPELDKALADAEHAHLMKGRIIRIYGHIGTPTAIEQLRARIDKSDVELRMYLLILLARWGYQAHDDEQEEILRVIYDEVNEAAYLYASQLDIAGGEPWQMLWHALDREAKDVRRRVLYLLSFVYPSQTILSVLPMFESEFADKRAYALEVLDNILDQDVKSIVFPVMDDLAPAERLQRLVSRFPQERKDRSERLKDLIVRSTYAQNVWTKSLSVYLAGKQPAPEFREPIVSIISDPDPFVRETALWSLAQIDPDNMTDYLADCLTDENESVSRLACLLMDSEKP